MCVYLQDLGLDLLELVAFAALAADLLVASVLLPQGVQQLHDLGLGQQLLVHGRPGGTAPSAALRPVEAALLQLRQQLMTWEEEVTIVRK